MFETNLNVRFNDCDSLGHVNNSVCDLLQEIGYAQKIKVYTCVSRIGKSSFDVEHSIEDENKNCIARGKAVLVNLKGIRPLCAGKKISLHNINTLVTTF